MLVVDRFEENIAVCEKEDKTIVKIPKYKLPLQTKEGDFITLMRKAFMSLPQKKRKKRSRKFMKDSISCLNKVQIFPNI